MVPKISGDLERGLRQSHFIPDSKRIHAITLVQGLSLQALSSCPEANFYSSKSLKTIKQAIPLKVCQGRKHKSSKHCGCLHLFFSKALCKFNGHANEILSFGCQASVKVAILLPGPGSPRRKMSDPRIHYLQFTSSSSHQPIALSLGANSLSATFPEIHVDAIFKCILVSMMAR